MSLKYKQVTALPRILDGATISNQTFSIARTKDEGYGSYSNQNFTVAAY